MPKYLTRQGNKRFFDPAPASALKPRSQGGRTLILTSTLTDPEILVSSERAGQGNIPLRVYNGLPPAPVDPGTPTTYLSPGMTYNGDKFLFSWTAVGTSNDVAVYRKWSPSRQWMRISGNLPSATVAWGDKVYDGLHPYYQVVELKPDGTEPVIATFDGVQPTRTNWVGAQVFNTNNATKQDLNIRITNTHYYPTDYNGNGSASIAPSAVTVNTNITGGTLQNCFVVCTGNAISMQQASGLTAQGNVFFQLHPGIGNSGPGRLVDAYHAAALTFKHNSSNGFSFGVFMNGADSNAVYASQYLQLLNITGNDFQNILSAVSTTSDYVMDDIPNAPFPGGSNPALGNQLRTNDHRLYDPGHIIQVSGCHRIASCNITWNSYQGEPGYSAVEDGLNWHNSSGTSTSRAVIQNNCFRGLYVRVSATGYAFGCAFINDGTSPSSDPTLNGYVNWLDNVALDFDNVGFGLYYGSNITVTGNKLMSTGRLPDGTAMKGANQAMAVYKAGDEVAGGYKNIVVTGNTLGNWRAHASGQYTPAGDSPAFIVHGPSNGSADANGNVGSYSQQLYFEPRPATPAMVQAEHKAWYGRAKTATQYIGFTPS